MAKYLRLTISMLGTEEEQYYLVGDTFKEYSAEYNCLVEEAIWDYVEVYSELLDESEVPEEDRTYYT